MVAAVNVMWCIEQSGNIVLSCGYSLSSSAFMYVVVIH